MVLGLLTFVVIVSVVASVVWLYLKGAAREEERINWEERRAHIRITPPAELPMHVQIIGRDFMEVPEIVNVSAGGLGIRVPHGLEGVDTASEVELVMKFAGHGSCRARGIIRHRAAASGHRMFFGVQFAALPAEDEARINAYVQSVLRLRQQGASTSGVRACAPPPADGSKAA